MTAAYNDSDGRRSRRQRSDNGRHAERRSISNFASNHTTRSSSKSKSSASMASSLRSQHHILPEDYSPSSGKEQGGIPRSPGAPPPPPPPRPQSPYPRGRNSSFYSVPNTAGGNNSSRGRSLSGARTASRSQSRSRHGEEKDADIHESNRIGRARSKKPTPSSTDELPLIDEKGRHQPRSRSRSKSRRVKDPKPRKHNTAADNSKAPPQKSFKQAMAEKRATSPIQHVTSNEDDVREQKIFKQVMAKNSASSHRSQRTRERSTTSQKPRNTKTASSPSSSSPSPAAKDQLLSASRKFVVEIGSNNEIIQLFEFSESGALPPSSKSNQKMLIENIRRRYSDDKTGSSRSSSRGRSTSRSRGTPNDRSTRKIVVESDGHNNIVQVSEFSNKGVFPAREESPFSKRASYAKHVNNATLEEEKPASPDDFMSKQKVSRSSSTRAASSKATVGGTLRSSLRSSMGLSRSNMSQASVRFALDSEGTFTPVVGFGIDDEIDESEVSSLASRSATSMLAEQDTSSVASKDHSAAYCQPHGQSALDTSETSMDSTSRRSVSFLMDRCDDRERPLSPSQVHATTSYQQSRGKSTLDTSERSDGSSRRSVSFIMDQDDNQIRGLSSSEPLLSSMFSSTQSRSMANEDLAGSRQVRPRSRSHSLVINDTSSMTAGSQDGPTFPSSHGALIPTRQARSRSRTHSALIANPISPPSRGITSAMSSSMTSYQGQALTPTRHAHSLSRTRNVPITNPTSLSSRGRSSAMSTLMASGHSQSLAPTREARSLSRTRDIPIRNHIDFDPVGSITETQQGNYDRVFRRGALPYEKVPIQKNMVSYSTEDTFISTLTIDEEDSFFANQISNVAKEGDPIMHFMNSTLTIFESKCDDEDQSLLSDPTSFMDPWSLLPTLQASTNRGVKVHIMEDDDTITEALKQERRSRIRRIISRRAAGKRRTKQADYNSSLLDISDETREMLGTDGSESPSCLMESAQNSLLHTRSSSGKHKSRLSRLLHR
mmetsp:Transcript_1499/g.3173  ORF Transcript_1499/g.3173 Transcript_1499/m.3173 type:complete len:1001 (+) Transcript_1499:108-3110(+)